MIEVDGYDFGPETDFEAVIRRRANGGFPVPRDRDVPDASVWLYSPLYLALQPADLHHALGAAAARLVADDDVRTRQAAACLLAAATDDPSTYPALRAALSGDRSLYRGVPSGPVGVAGGLEAVLLTGLASAMPREDAWGLEQLRDAVVRPGLAGAALAGLEAYDPHTLVRAGVEIVTNSPDFLQTVLVLTAPFRANLRTRCVAPLCDVTARLVRGGVDADAVRAVIPALRLTEPAAAAMHRVIDAPRAIGAYDDGPVTAEDTAASLVRRAKTPGGASGAVLWALVEHDAGFLQRRLMMIVDGTPGSLGSLIKILISRSVEPGVLAGRLLRAGIDADLLSDVALTSLDGPAATQFVAAFANG